MKDQNKDISKQELNEPLFLLFDNLSKKIDNLEEKINKIISKQDQNRTVLPSSSPISQTDELGDLRRLFENLDSLLVKYFQKFSRDNNKLFDQISSLQKNIEDLTQNIAQKPESVIKIVDKADKPKKVVEARDYVNSLPAEPNFNQDKGEVNSLILYFQKKNIFTTGAIKTVEDTRDKLLFERSSEAPYRGFAAKAFREILGIIKSEKDFSTLSLQASQDIIHQLELLYERV